MAKFQRHLDIALIYYSCLLTSTFLAISEPKTILAEDNNSQLRLVSAVFRHGDRTIDRNRESYPTDPYQNNSFYPIADGHLTNAGKRRAYKLGILLRERYNDFLGDVYYPPNVYARSTEKPRCKMTLQLVLAGLYPPCDIQKWNPELAWQPIDLMYVSPLDDPLLPILNPRYIEVYNDVRRSSEVIKKIAEFDDLMKKVSNYTNRDIKFEDLINLYVTLYVQLYMELNLPKWTQDIFPNGKLFDAAVFYFKLLSYKQLNNLNGVSWDNMTRKEQLKILKDLFLLKYFKSRLLKIIIDDMNKVINGTLVNRKINLFSGHDINVSAFLYALNISEYSYPAYTSSVILELHENNGNYFVKVLYHLGIPSETKEVSIPGCEILCPYNKFLELTSESIKAFEQPTPLSKNPKIGKQIALFTI